MPDISQSVTADALIEARNWANRCQWCAHEFLQDVTSEESRNLAAEDFVTFWDARWNCRLQPLSEFVEQSLCDEHRDKVFPFLERIGKERGLHFGHAGLPVEFAHESAVTVAEWVYGVADNVLPVNESPKDASEAQEAIHEMSRVIRWNPKELESEIFAEHDYAVAVMRGKTTPDDEQPPPNTNGSWLKSGLPPEGWHKTPLCGEVKEISRWAGTTPKTLRSRNGVIWWVTPWIGEADKSKPPTPFAIYFPTEPQYSTANQRRITLKQVKAKEEKGNKGERKGALRKKRKAK